MENNEALIRKNIILNKRKIMADVAAVIMFALLLWYLYVNIEEVKMANNNPCKLCETKTDNVCSCKGNAKLDYKSSESYEINFSSFEIEE